MHEARHVPLDGHPVPTAANTGRNPRKEVGEGIEAGLAHLRERNEEIVVIVLRHAAVSSLLVEGETDLRCRIAKGHQPDLPPHPQGVIVARHHHDAAPEIGSVEGRPSPVPPLDPLVGGQVDEGNRATNPELLPSLNRPLVPTAWRSA